MERKFLVAVDGSTYSYNALRYLAQLFENNGEIRLHLVSFTPPGNNNGLMHGLVSDSQWLPEEELLAQAPPELRAKATKCRTYLNEALIQLARLGFSPEQVTTEVKCARASIADDLTHEARKGLYDALVIGRRGIGKLEELILGSVSTSVLEKSHDLPVWIIDGRVSSRRFLVPIDGSPPNLKAIDHLCHVLHDNPHAEITLFLSKALIANRKEIAPHECIPLYGEEWCNMHLPADEKLFDTPEQMLLDSGIPAARINRLMTKTGLYPSRQIVRQALTDEFGTIVMGREHDFKRSFFSSTLEKVIGMAVDVSIWVV